MSGKKFKSSLHEHDKTAMKVAENSIFGERKFRLMQQRNMEGLGDNLRREKYLRHQLTSDTLYLLTLFEKPDTAKLVREVAIALMSGHYVNIPCASGESVSSETGWDGRKKDKKDKEDENFRLRCRLHGAKTAKAAHKTPDKQGVFV